MQSGRIAQPRAHHHQPFERPEPYRSLQLDLKDASTVTIEPGGKKQHLVEILNVVDEGCSAWLEGIVRDDFNASTILQSMQSLLDHWGLPQQVTFDRDPRFVGAHMLINPDKWLYTIDGKRFARKVKANGSVEVARHSYYVGTQHAGKYVAVYVDAPQQEFSIRQRDKELRRLAIKGLYHGRELTFEEYLALMVEEARSEQRQFYQARAA